MNSIASGTETPDFQLHSIGWKAFQDLCLTILQDQLSQAVARFSPVKDGGKDGAFVGKWRASPGLEITGKTVVQCKFTNRRDASLTVGAFREETAKAKALWRRRPRDNYVLLTNYRVTGEFEEVNAVRFARFGCSSFHVFGVEWITAAIQESSRLRTLVPRLYGLGDLSQILDERWYEQTSKLLETERENLRKFVPTRSYRRAVSALNKHGFVLLLGEPAIGKTAIAATLALASGDAWKCRPMKLDRAADIRDHWNPLDPKQFFWVDDAFGATQYDSERSHEWNSVLPMLTPLVKSGSKLVLTSRDYIYSRARRDLKQSAFPLLREAQVVVNVAELSSDEREQILYNHIKMGDQSRTWRREFKSFFDQVSQHVGFKPEIARRLGTSTFTGKLKLSSQGISDFVAKPEEFLRESIEGLSNDDRASLAAIFLRGGSLRSPVTLTEGENQIIVRLGGTKGGITDSLDSMKDTFVRYAPIDAEHWVFRHPTIADAFASFIGGNPELVDMYVSGAPMEKMLQEVTCGRTGLIGVKVVVPKPLFGVMIRRLDEYLRSTEGTFFDVWTRRSRFFDFLAGRCSKGFLESYIKEAPSFWEEALDFSSHLSVSREFLLLVKLHQEDLLNPEVRRKVVERVKGLAVNTPDADFLTVDQIRGFFTKEEILDVMRHVQESLVPNLSTIIDQWRDTKPEAEQASSHFFWFKDALEAFRQYFESDPEVCAELTMAIEKVDGIISDDDLLTTNSESDSDSKKLITPRPTAAKNRNRRIYDDLDR
jgi:hypothetical protein